VEERVKFLDFFRLSRPRPPTADLAKQRLQVIIAHERHTGGPDFLPLLQKELIQVIRKYVEIDPARVRFGMEKGDGVSVLEVNIEIPAGSQSRAAV
jgi:cell division topological specificity factor